MKATLQSGVSLGEYLILMFQFRFAQDYRNSFVI